MREAAVKKDRKSRSFGACKWRYRILPGGEPRFAGWPAFRPGLFYEYFLVGRIMTLGLFRLAGYILSLDEVSVQHLDTCCWTVTQKKVVLAVRVASFHVYCSMTVLGTQHAMRRPISRYSVKLFY